MISHVSDEFREAFAALPEAVKNRARRNYRLWKSNPQHPSLRFKQVHPSRPIYSARVGIGWRVLGLKEEGCIIWFWIGSHARYEQIIAQL